MPLLDSVLLDPHKSALDVWIALRTDGVKGSGTESDPYNGSPRYESSISVSTLTRFGREAAATTATNHGYANGDVVTISGVTGTGAPFYNGTFVIYSVMATSFKYWMKAEPGASGSGTITCARTFYQFDELLINVGENTAIHLGPGLFLTRGYGDQVAGSQPQPKSGQQIIGSGMEATTLKLVNASVPNSKYYVIATATHLQQVEISDLTLDCNLDGQLIASYTFAPIGCSGVYVSGAHLRYRRVRAINFGTLDPPQEPFVLWSAGAYPNDPLESVDCVIEDCIVEQPAINNYGGSTCINMGGGERASDGITAYHRACVIRNCVVDCEYKVNPVPISQITFAGMPPVATVTTRLPHGLVANDWVRISGAIVNGLSDNPFNGSYQIASATSTTFQYTMPSTPAAAPVGDMWVGRFSSHYAAISSLSVTSAGPPEWTVRLVTATPHFRVPGNNVVVNNVTAGGSFTNPFNGSFLVTAVGDLNNPDPKILYYKTTTDPGTPDSSQIFAFINVQFQAMSNDAGTGAVVEGNRVFNCRLGGPYHDTYNTRDLIVRNNFYRGIVTGPSQSLGNTSKALGVIRYHNTNPNISYDRIKSTGDGKTALFTTQYNHGYSVGQAVKIDLAKVNGSANNPYNGYFAVDSVPALNQFTYRMLSDPGADADASPVPQFETLWQTGSIVIENNLIELIGSINAYGPPVAIILAKYAVDASIGSQRLYKRVVVRNNIIRFVENASDAPNSEPSAGISLVYCEDALVENNVVDLAISLRIVHAVCDQIRYFNNTDSSGTLIQGVDAGQTGNPKQSELTTAVEDALMSAI